MGIFQKMANLLSPNTEVRNKLFEAVYQWFNGQFYTLTQNKKTYVDEGYQKNISVYSVIRMIAGKAAGAKFEVQTMKGDKSEPIKNVNDPLCRLMKKPNEFQRGQQFIEECISWLLITGDLYIYKIKRETGADKGSVSRFYCLPSQYVQIIGGGFLEPVKEYKLIIGDQEIRFDKEEITHLKYFNPNWDVSGSQLYGQSPLMAALATVQSSNEGTNAKIKAYLNGGVVGLLTNTDPNVKLTVEQREQLQNLVNERVRGTDNQKSIVATSAPVSYQQIGMSPADLEVLKSIEFDKNAICMAFGIDPILFSTETASYNNKSEAGKNLVNNVVSPILELLTETLNEAVMVEGKVSDKFISFDISHFPELQEDIKEMVTALKDAYWISPNEKRVKMKYEPSKDPLMDKYYIPTSLQPIEEIDYSMPLNEE
jgi:HK97 family phage portal protein